MAPPLSSTTTAQTRRILSFLPAAGLPILVILGAVGLLTLEAPQGPQPMVLIVATAVVLLVLDPLLSYATLAHAEIEVRSASLAYEGTALPVRLLVTGVTRPVKVRMLSLAGDPFAWAEDGREGIKPIALPGRGCYGAASFEIVAVGPLGMLGWRRVLAVRLDPPLLVAPVPVPYPEDVLDLAGADDDLVPTRVSRGGQVRGVRDHERGDGMSVVHWPATARAGHLVVKEHERAGRGALHVVLAIDAEGLAAEEAARRASGLLRLAVERGWRVWLTTVELGIPNDAAEAIAGGDDPDTCRSVALSYTISAEVTTPAAIDARLARAAAGAVEQDRLSGPRFVVASHAVDGWMG